MTQFPRASEYPIGSASNFVFLIRGDINNFVFIPAIKDTGNSPVWRGCVGSASACCIRQARIQFSARHHREVFPTELPSDEDMANGDGSM